jgi:hypothetical protein
MTGCTQFPPLQDLSGALVELAIALRPRAEGGLALDDPKGSGALAGAHQGDIIITWNGEPIRHLRSVLRALGADSVG